MNYHLTSLITSHITHSQVVAQITVAHSDRTYPCQFPGHTAATKSIFTPMIGFYLQCTGVVHPWLVFSTAMFHFHHKMIDFSLKLLNQQLFFIIDSTL